MLLGAIALLKKQTHDRNQSSSHVQASALTQLSVIPTAAEKAIDAFLQQDPKEGLAVDAPEANAYEFQSSGAIKMLEKWPDKFVDDRLPF